MKKKKRRKIWPVVFAVILFLIILAAAVVLLFRTRTVKVKGNSYYSENTITTLVQSVCSSVLVWVIPPVTSLWVSPPPY